MRRCRTLYATGSINRWCDRPAKHDGPCSGQLLPRYRVGDQVVLTAPGRLVKADGLVHGAGGMILDRGILDRPAVVYSVGSHVPDRMLIGWDGGDVGLWVDMEDAIRARGAQRVGPVMGTYITPGYTRDETVREQLEEVRPKAHVLVGQCLWMIATVPAESDSPLAGRDLIVLDVLTPSGDGYKPMDETMGPYYHSVPLSWLERVPDPREGYSTKWRAAVRAWHAKRPLPMDYDQGAPMRREAYLDTVRPDEVHG